MIKSSFIKLLVTAIMLSSGVLVGQDTATPKPLDVQVASIPFVWPTTAAEASRITKGQILQLFQEMDTVVGGKTYSLGSYMFAKLDGKSFYLIATPDASGRELYYSIDIVMCIGITCRLDIRESDGPHDLAREIIDPDGDGHYVLLTKELVGQYRGTATKPIYIYKIHRIEDGRVVDVSAQYRALYDSKIVPAMKANEATVLSRYAANENEMKEAQAEIDYAYREYERRIRGENEAGLAEARQWAVDSDPRIQELAVATLADMNSAEAKGILQQMVNNPNAYIQSRAKSELERKKEIIKHD
jgi:hypothetical protein